MFFLVSLHRNVHLHPSQMDATWQSRLRDMLKSEVVGTCDGKTALMILLLYVEIVIHTTLDVCCAFVTVAQHVRVKCLGLL